MKNTYTELLEQIITEMKISILGGNGVVVDSDYRQWLDFLRQVHPESELLRSTTAQAAVSASNARDDPNTDTKIYTDLRSIIQLAATHDHPTWYIQPHFTGSIAGFIYENNELQNALPIHGLPKIIEGFTGTICGVWLNEQTFIAYGADGVMGFVKSQEFLKQAGFTTPDFALFPTDRLMALSVSKLEVSLTNFISTAQKKWAEVDGVMIVSDTSIFSGNKNEQNNRIIFKQPILSLTI
ncbi:MAG: hypothetical protein A2817_01740 [Candidatus Yanofskybacteria bacterium RIFCSPHIGHO2_01_FULL_39_8b]|uniref:Uncharacterized protein n=1 Tax=Candidatus Yanofskybacteria bacterium RIFCSPHIGHO2_01_FULL_39_8b TaxID=1802659 RepID=A0A1F8EAS1_9BACT|nr:MAG: hypothetical protein A2817_01740 [Candidatus Yanofskybacteria bacterium RIFCSPHIGHO2_01_FULL_39_8b]